MKTSDYLAKDYASFRRLMLDRISTLVPGWEDSGPADLGVALVELLAYVGDHLSYRQDAVATEAYLETARRRVSVRRHARLVDYPMHNGSNARVWVRFEVTADRVRLPAGTLLLTRVPGYGARLGADQLDAVLAQEPEVFETLHEVTLFKAHEKMSFTTSGTRRCCLPKEATRATLKGAFPELQAGDVLVFEEVLGPRTGKAADADPEHRHAVCLTHVALAGPQSNTVTEIHWAEDDAPPFPLCISSLTEDDQHLSDVSVARGNVVLADHGRRIRGEALGTVPEPNAALTRLLPADGGWTDEGWTDGGCQEPRRLETPPRFRPALERSPLTWATPYPETRLFGLPWTQQLQDDLDGGTIPDAVKRLLAERGVTLASASLAVRGSKNRWSLSDGERGVRLRQEKVDEKERLNVYELPPAAAELMREDPRDVEPAVVLRWDTDDKVWRPRHDLLASGKDAREFVVETESDGTAFLRFGDDTFGRRPEPGSAFTADYRIGNGTRGNVGARSLDHVVTSETAVQGVSNPMPASGGRDPEPLERVRQLAPYAFRRQERAVTAADYEAIAERHPGVQRAAATLRWTGSWHTVFVTVDRLGGLEVDQDFEDEMRRFLEPYRLVGHDLEIDQPRFVPLEIAMRVCVEEGYFPAQVEAALLERFSCRRLADGRLGVFHPDNLTFGQPVYLSPLYAEAQEVDGVASVRIETFERRGSPGRTALGKGKIELGRLEIARLDNDPSFPENGVFRLTLEGGS